MCVLLLVQSAVCILRFALTDIWAGFIMAIIIGFGWYAWYQNMSMMFICYWGLIGLIHGAFDLVHLIDFQVKSRYPLFSRRLPFSYNLHAAARLLEPIVMLLGSLFAWYLYRYDVPDSIYERPNTADWQGTAASGRPSTGPSSALTGGRTLGQGFSTFSGAGHRLGS